MLVQQDSVFNSADINCFETAILHIFLQTGLVYIAVGYIEISDMKSLILAKLGSDKWAVT